MGIRHFILSGTFLRMRMRKALKQRQKAHYTRKNVFSNDLIETLECLKACILHIGVHLAHGRAPHTWVCISSSRGSHAELEAPRNIALAQGPGFKKTTKPLPEAAAKITKRLVFLVFSNVANSNINALQILQTTTLAYCRVLKTNTLELDILRRKDKLVMAWHGKGVNGSWIDDKGSTPKARVKYGTNERVALPGPQPTLSSVISCPPVAVWCVRMAWIRASG